MVTNTNFGENENKSFVDGCNIDGKRGTYIKGEDAIHLDAPEIFFPEDAPLDTELRELYAILNELFQGGGEGGDWQPPDWWIPVPEPEPYDIYILIQVEKAGKKFDIQLGDQQGYTGMGTIYCNWGDGTEENYGMGPPPSHTYTETGQFLIHITGSENAFFLSYWNFNDAYNGSRDIVGLIIKTGANIAFRIDYYDSINYNYTTLFASKSFKYIKIMHPKGIPAETRNSYFYNCYDLQKIELAKKISGELPQYIFQNCYALKNFERFVDCDSVTKIGNYAFNNCYRLQEVNFTNCTELVSSAFAQCYNLIRANFPSCTAIGDYGFSQCYNLQELTTADDCTYQNNRGKVNRDDTNWVGGLLQG